MQQNFEVREQFAMRHKQTGETQSIFNGCWKGDKANWKKVGGLFCVIDARTGIQASRDMSRDFAEKCAAAFNQGKLFCTITGESKDA